jgi:hypothetical protein
MGVTWAVVLDDPSRPRGGSTPPAVYAERVFLCAELPLFDLPPHRLVEALQLAPRGARILVDASIVDGRPITAGLARAFAERRGLQLEIPVVLPESVIIYAACRSVFATVTTVDPRHIASKLRGDGLSLSQIAKRLESLGYRAPNGGPWFPASVRRLLEAGDS